MCDEEGVLLCVMRRCTVVCDEGGVLLCVMREVYCCV